MKGKEIRKLAAAILTVSMVLMTGCGRAPANPVNSLNDLEGKRIGVQLKTTGDSYATDIRDADVQRFNKGYDAILALRAGEIDAVMLDDAPANVFVKEFGDIRILEEAYADEEYGIAVSKENPELLQKINEALEKLQSEGVIDRIVKAWIEDGETISAYDGQTKDSYAGGTLLMVTNADFPPYEDYAEDGTVIGIDVDIMKAICDELDMKLQVEHTSFDSLIASVQRGTADVAMAAMTITEERLEQVAFSNVYMSAKQVIIVRSK